MRRRPRRRRPRDDAYSGNFPAARAEAIARSNGICQGCGCAEAREAHHWAGMPGHPPYPAGADVTADDLTGLCQLCHYVITLMRRAHRYGVPRTDLRRAIDAAFLQVNSGEPLPSSNLERQDIAARAAPQAQPLVRGEVSRLRPAQAQTGRPQASAVPKVTAEAVRKANAPISGARPR